MLTTILYIAIGVIVIALLAGIGLIVYIKKVMEDFVINMDDEED